MAVESDINSFIAKFMELSRLGYDAQLVVSSVYGHLTINI